MNRRLFLRNSSLAAVALTLPSLEGCTITKASLESWAQSVDTAVTTVLEGLGASALAGELATYLQQFDTAVNDFPTTGGKLDKILAVAQDIITVLSDIGIPTAILTIADLCISVVVTFISNISNGTVTASVPNAPLPAAYFQGHTISTIANGGFRGVTVTHFTGYRQAAQKWNAALEGTPYANHKVRVPLF